jgi:hypothetical protein
MAEKIWLKRVLIPLWIIQLLILGAFAASAALSLYVVDNTDIELGDRLENAVK